MEMDQPAKDSEQISDLGLKIICIGHFIKREEDCYDCKIDDFNKNCPNYRPWQIVAYYVIPEDGEAK